MHVKIDEKAGPIDVSRTYKGAPSGMLVLSHRRRKNWPLRVLSALSTRIIRKVIEFCMENRLQLPVVIEK